MLSEINKEQLSVLDRKRLHAIREIIGLNPGQADEESVSSVQADEEELALSP
jgi:hypothetical protein